jgi:hypothetical protein
LYSCGLFIFASCFDDDGGGGGSNVFCTPTETLGAAAPLELVYRRVTNSRSNRSRAGRSSFGYSMCRVKRVDFVVSVACLRGLDVVVFAAAVVVVVSDGIGGVKELMREVMKVRDCGSDIVYFPVGFDGVFSSWVLLPRLHVGGW